MILARFTPNNNKSQLIINLFKHDSFVKKLIPYGFSQFFDMVDNKDSISAIVLKNPDFLSKMNKYRGALTYTLKEMIEASKYKDKLIEGLLAKDGLIDMLDEKGAELLINNHSNPEMVRDTIMDAEFDDDFDDDDEYGMSESIKMKGVIISELRRRFGRII